MQEIGKFLKENRIKQKKSIDDISNITKMNINIIKNIEEGNVEYFNNDLTYLRYYVRAYANAINVDFNSLDDNLQEAILGYTKSINILEKEKIDQLNKKIKTKQTKISPNLTDTTLNKAKRVDWTLISLISIVILIVLFLSYSIAANFFKEEKPNENPPIVDNDKDKDDDKNKEEPDDIIDEIFVKVEKENANTYLLSDFDDDLIIKTKFNVNTWVQIKVNELVINIPSENFLSKTYLANEELVIPIKYVVNNEERTLNEGDIITIRYGIMNSNEFYINDELLELDDEIKTALGGTNVIFKLEKKLDK